MTGRRRRQGAAEAGITARERILTAFAQRARVEGIRAVVMSDLARELGMSKKTLYQHFESKDALVREIVQRWVDQARRNARSPEAPLHDPHALLRWWTDLWIQGQTDFCGEFWRDLGADHPEAVKLMQEAYAAALPIQLRVAQVMRRDVNALVASELYNVILGYFNDPVVCRKFGFSPREAVLSAVEIWIGGALRPPVRLDSEVGIEDEPVEPS